MQNLGIYISELLAEHDCVIVPGFGGFVARPAPAHFAKSGHLLLPPGKSLVFNTNLDKNDGLLINHLAIRLGIDYREAGSRIEQWVLSSRRQLEVQKRLELERTGILYYSPENNLLFEPSAYSNHQVDSFGLAAVQAVPLETPREITVETVKQYRKPVPAGRNKMVARIGLVVSSVLLFAFLIFLTADNLPLRNALASLNPFAPNEPAYKTTSYDLGTLFRPAPEKLTPVIQQNTVVRLSENSGRTFIVVSDTAESDKTRVSRPVKNISSGNNFNAPFQIVVGCFAVEENANRLIRQLHEEHVPAGISGRNARGLYIVSIAGFTTESMARTKLEQVKHRFPAAWILLK